ncbi:serine/threonine-protein kinase MRCK alpha [Nematostella vectensis]|uniref:serine/threonine-protein kinase MRCK alpha n=1 Tax=Nematostella vectensis TaxID=45351 RepID=UPI0020772D70|nr:serine/threonine-protein kinase MRCK alpha [Nematostella vectensis]
MTLKPVRSRVTLEERVEQESRLTGKHIKTLVHLQDIHSENERLKARVAELEICEVRAGRVEGLEREIVRLKDELSSCKEVHECAQNSKVALQKLQKDCLAKIDSSNRLLTEKHKAEMLRLVSQKLEEENNWVTERQKLIEKIRELEELGRCQKDAIDKLENSFHLKNDLDFEIQQRDRELERAKKENKHLNEALLAQQEAIKTLTCENESMQKSMDNLCRDVKVMKMQQKQSRDLTFKMCCETQTDLLGDELESMEEKFFNYEKENSLLRGTIKSNESLIGTLEFNLQDSTQTLKLLYKERDLLKNRITGLLDEIKELRSQKPESKQTFSDFVQLKRDFTNLRDEHEKLLKKRSAKPNVLPCLTADAKTVTRTFGRTLVSRNSIGSLNSS